MSTPKSLLRSTGRCTYDPRLRLNPALAIEVMTQLRENSELSEASDDDFSNLALMVLARRAERPLLGHNKGVPLFHTLFRRCKILAADAVARTWGEVEYRYRDLLRGYYRGLQMWGAEFIGLAHDRVNGVPLPSRENQVLDAFLGIIATCGIRRDFVQFGRAAGLVLQSLSQEDDTKEDDTKERRTTLTTYLEVTEDRVGGMFISTGGKLFLGHRQLRDSHAHTFGISRSRNATPRSVETKQDTDEGRDIEDSCGESPSEIAEELDAVQTIHQLLDHRLQATQPGSLRAHVLENFDALTIGELSVRELAKGVGMDSSAMSRVFRSEFEEIQKEMGGNPEK